MSGSILCGEYMDWHGTLIVSCVKWLLQTVWEIPWGRVGVCRSQRDLCLFPYWLGFQHTAVAIFQFVLCIWLSSTFKFFHYPGCDKSILDLNLKLTIVSALLLYNMRPLDHFYFSSFPTQCCWVCMLVSCIFMPPALIVTLPLGLQCFFSKSTSTHLLISCSTLVPHFLIFDQVFFSKYHFLVALSVRLCLVVDALFWLTVLDLLDRLGGTAAIFVRWGYHPTVF